MAIDINSELIITLKRIASALEKLANDGKPTSPNMHKALADFSTFDWESIGASVVQADKFGPTHVEHEGQVYTRRSPQNKFGAAIWYSRSVGKDENGENVYARLITFSEINKSADPLPENVQAKVQDAAQPAPARHEIPVPAPVPAKPQDDLFAMGEKYGLAAESVAWLIKVATDESLSMAKNADKIKLLIPILAEAKSLGIDGKTIAAYLKTGEYQPDKCRKIIRELKKG